MSLGLPDWVKAKKSSTNSLLKSNNLVEGICKHCGCSADHLRGRHSGLIYCTDYRCVIERKCRWTKEFEPKESPGIPVEFKPKAVPGETEQEAVDWAMEVEEYNSGEAMG